MTEPLLQVRGLTFGYGRELVLDHVDLDINPRDFLAVIGPNGGGKTTLIKAILGLLRPWSGEVISRIPRGHMGYVPQFSTFDRSFPLRVRDVVLMGRAPHLGFLGFPGERDRALTDAALDRVGLLHLKDRPYTRLSGGERQLVLLARTLVQGPDIILLDEPTAHLDLHNQVLTLRMVRSLAADGMTMIMTTHDPNHALWFGGRAALMKAGSFVAIGPVQDVMTEATLTSTYDVAVSVFSQPSHRGHDPLPVCSAWLPESS